MIFASTTIRKILAALAVVLSFACIHDARADESLSIYGLKGYGFVISPEVSTGTHVQGSVLYSRFNGKIENRDGYVVATPLSLTHGSDGLWEVAVATDWESWENTDFDESESGLGDVFAGGKVRLLGRNKKDPLDLSLMPYILIPGGNHDKSIGDLYNFNPSPEDDFSYGANLLLGKRVGRFYLTGNLGINYLDTDLDYLEDNAVFAGVALEYHISESLMAYAEYFGTENKNDLECDPCFDKDVNDDMSELGAGLVYIRQRWGFRVHGGTGLTDTTPNFRLLASINRGF
ncbi:MAG: transporter [Thermodesulfobacteriota bacterium]